MRDTLITVVGVIGCVLLVVGLGLIGSTALAVVAVAKGGTEPGGSSGAVAGVALTAVAFLAISIWTQLRGAASRGRDSGSG